MPSIAGAIKRHFRDNGWSVRVPRDLQELALRVERVSDELLAETGHTADRRADRRRAPASRSRTCWRRARPSAPCTPTRSTSRAARARTRTRGSLLDTLGDADLELVRAHDRTALYSVLDTLDERDRAIIRLYYEDELTQAEIGRRLGYSQMHVSRLLRQAVERLRLTAAQQEDQVTELVSSAAA